MKAGFLEKLVSRLDRVESGEAQQFLSRLIREKGLLEQVFEALREGVILLDAHGVITFVNQAACRFFGFHPDRAVGASLSGQIRGLDWDSLMQPAKTISRDVEVFYPENRYLNFYIAPIGDGHPDDSLPKYVMLVRDLTTSRQETEQTLESERLNTLTLLAAGVAHEIGNPLNSLDIHLQLLNRKFKKLKAAQRPELEEHLATARQEIRRLDTILRQFLQAVRPTTPHRDPTNLHAVLQETLRLLEPELASRHISVELNLAAHLPVVEIDAAQFQQVFYNLLRNAYQAVQPHTGRISISTSTHDYECQVSIRDNGTGISPEHMGSLFEPFRSTKQAGTGLGLLIVRRIIREHGGEIEIESQDGYGTRVVLHIPRGVKSARLLAAPAPVIELSPPPCSPQSS